ncbi:protein mono-ADP-ribosyltransferase PARP12-like isoform X2 [Physella acuta]|nr:protein mono-ADP-ribosyltransferase PARP12-like isoform X2 [Physella acuta]
MMTLYPVRYIQHLCYLFDSNCTINYDNSVPIFPPSLPLIQEDHLLKPVQFYDVSPWTEEGRLISQKFHQTLCVPHYCIVRVFKIHNPVLWQQYVQRKYQLFYELGGMAAAEQRLFHGTYQANLTGIATKGFDWKSGKKHGKLLGYGTYFAKDARCAHEFTDCGGNYCSARWDDPCCKKLDTGSSLCQQFQPLMV